MAGHFRSLGTWCLRSDVPSPAKFDSVALEQYDKYIASLSLSASTAEGKLIVVRMLYVLKQ